jgi:hypothetical protein
MEQLGEANSGLTCRQARPALPAADSDSADAYGAADCLLGDPGLMPDLDEVAAFHTEAGFGESDCLFNVHRART